MKAILTTLCTFISVTMLMWSCGTTDPDVAGNTNTGGTDNGGSSSGAENSDTTCDDGADNDGNGYTDCDDFDCQNSCDVTVCGAENSEDACSDGIDNSLSILAGVANDSIAEAVANGNLNFIIEV